jgi:hypothetical protein
MGNRDSSVGIDGGLLWTGDKRLIRGLLGKDFRKVITTDALFALREGLK